MQRRPSTRIEADLPSSSHTTNSFFGPTRSHLDSNGQSLSAGGSSGGSAVAVATDQCHAYVLRPNASTGCFINGFAAHLEQILVDRCDCRQHIPVLWASSLLTVFYRGGGLSLTLIPWTLSVFWQSLPMQSRGYMVGVRTP